jgi:hypothetical protein
LAEPEKTARQRPVSYLAFCFVFRFGSDSSTL